MSNLLSIHNSKNQIGIGTNSISVSSSLTIKEDSKRYIVFNTGNDSIDTYRPIELEETTTLSTVKTNSISSPKLLYIASNNLISSLSFSSSVDRYFKVSNVGGLGLVDRTAPIVASFIISGSPVGIGSQAPVHLQFDTPVQNFAYNEDISTENGTISLSNPTNDKMTWIGYFTPTTDPVEDTTNILTLNDNYEDLSGNKGVSATTDNYIVDTINPSATISYSSNSPYKDGTTITITANFNNEMKTNPVPQISISAPESLNATNMTRVSATQYTYSYTVSTSNGNGTCTISLSNGTDLAGNSITTTPTSGSTFIVDNTAPSFSQGSYSFSISSKTSGSDVGSVSATDTYSITYSIVSDSSNIFAINSSNGVITLSTNCSDGNYTLSVRATDTASNTRDVNISVKVDTTVPSFSTTSFSISTGTTAVGTVIATDPSPASNPIVYTIVAGAHGSYFSITNPGGVLSLISPLHAAGTYTVNIRATDALDNHSDQSITVTLTTPFGTNWEKIEDLFDPLAPNPINTTHITSSTKNYLTKSSNWASWSNSSIKEYVMVEFELFHTGTTGYQILLTLGANGLAVSPQWYVIFNASTNWFSTPANKIVITNNSITAGQQSWVDSTSHTGTNPGIAQGSDQGKKPGVGIRSQTNFSTSTTYKVKIVWEARLPDEYTSLNSSTEYKARTNPGIDTTQIYLYVDSGSGYVLDTYTPNYAQSWSYGMGANYPPASGYGGEISQRDNVGLGQNAMQSYFNIGYYYWSSSYGPLRSGTTVKPLQLCKIKKKSSGQYNVNSSTF